MTNRITKEAGQSKLHDFTRGGQTTLHSLRMFGQIVRWMVRIYSVFVALIFVYFLWFKPEPYYDRYVGLKYLQAALYGDFSKNATVPFTERNGTSLQVPAWAVLSNPNVLRAKAHMTAFAWQAAKVSGWVGLALLLGIGTWFWRKGRGLRSDRFVRGGAIMSQEHLQRWLRKSRRPLSDYRLCGIPYFKNAETLHTFVSGGPGQGKTVVIQALLDQIRKNGDRAIVYDKMGVYTQHYYHPQEDIILNPLDARAPSWNIFAEARHQTDFETLASVMIPMANSDPFWTHAARTVFSELAGKMRAIGETQNQRFLERLLGQDMESLAALLQGTPAHHMVDARSPKMALSVLAMLAGYVKCLRYVKDQGTCFSIRKWIEQDAGKGFLIISSRGDQHESLKPLISAWLDIAVNQLLSLAQSQTRRIWVILDELPTLHKLPSLSAGLAESRQFGGCFVISIQSLSQLRDIYGRDGADALSGLCSNRVVFKSPEPETAQWSSRALGGVELDEVKEGFSYGANEMRDGVSMAVNKMLRPLVIDTEILNLNALHGYLKLSGDSPVARIHLTPITRKAVAPRFVQAPDFETLAQPTPPDNHIFLPKNHAEAELVLERD